jgi:hypothetical protein
VEKADCDELKVTMSRPLIGGLFFCQKMAIAIAAGASI